MAKKHRGMSYTRQDHIRGSPQTKMAKFAMGKASDKYDYTVSLVAQSQNEVGAEALESARIAALKVLEKEIASGEYRLLMPTYPHEIVREHKQMGFAGADRMSQGMSRSFGKPTKRAARLSENQAVLNIDLSEDKVSIAKKALKRASNKLPPSWYVIAKKTR